jgi:hypothetical protein
MTNYQRALQLRIENKFEEGYKYLKLAAKEDKDETSFLRIIVTFMT